MTLDASISCPKCSLRTTAGVPRCHRCGQRLLGRWQPLVRLLAAGLLLLVLLLSVGVIAFLSSAEFARMRLDRDSSLVELQEASRQEDESVRTRRRSEFWGLRISTNRQRPRQCSPR